MAAITRIEPLTLSQNTAVGRNHGKPRDWYLYERFVAGCTYWEAAQHPTDADFRPVFVCAVTAPLVMVGTTQEVRAEIATAVLKHAAEIGVISL